MTEKKPCILCGHEYEVCQRCEEIAKGYTAKYGFAPWRTVACSVECYQIYEVLRQYGYKYISEKDAKDMLAGITLPDSFVNSETRELVEKILSYIPEQPTTNVPKVKPTKVK